MEARGVTMREAAKKAIENELLKFYDIILKLMDNEELPEYKKTFLR